MDVGVLPVINRFMTMVFDSWIWALQGLPQDLQICITALPLTIFALLVFRLVSNQGAIQDAKDKIKAHLLELRLFQDDLAIAIRTQGQIFRYSFRYLGAALLPAAVMFIPVLLVVFQVEARYAWRGIQPGESVILMAQLSAAHAVQETDARLTLPPSFVQETPALRIAETNEVLWRIRALEPGQHRVTLNLGGQTYERRVVTQMPGVGLSPVVYQSTNFATLTVPTETPLVSDANVSVITLAYPRARSQIIGLSSASWILFIASLVLGLLLRGAFHVTF